MFHVSRPSGLRAGLLVFRRALQGEGIPAPDRHLKRGFPTDEVPWKELVLSLSLKKIFQKRHTHKHTHTHTAATSQTRRPLPPPDRLREAPSDLAVCPDQQRNGGVDSKGESLAMGIPT